jgi:hypothetical protein
LKPLIRPPAKPSPISARAIVRVARSVPIENSSAPAARSEPVEQQAERQLEQREREQVGRGQKPEPGRAEPDVGDQPRADHRVHRAEEIGQKVPGSERR